MTPRVRPRTLVASWLLAVAWLVGLPAPTFAHAAESAGTITRVAAASSSVENATAVRMQRPVVTRFVRTDAPSDAGPVADLGPLPVVAALVPLLLVAAAALPRPRFGVRTATRGRSPPQRPARRAGSVPSLAAA
ncbi:MAG: hypothetical protein ACT4QG_05210 [Sporichthyaceae bacterium]